MKKIKIENPYNVNEFYTFKIYKQKGLRTKIVLNDFDSFLLVDKKPILLDDNMLYLESTLYNLSDKTFQYPVAFCRNDIFKNTCWLSTDCTSELITEPEGFSWKDYYSCGIVRQGINKTDALLKVLIELF